MPFSLLLYGEACVCLQVDSVLQLFAASEIRLVPGEYCRAGDEYRLQTFKRFMSDSVTELLLIWTQINLLHLSLGREVRSARSGLRMDCWDEQTDFMRLNPSLYLPTQATFLSSILSDLPWYLSIQLMQGVQKPLSVPAA